MGFAFPLIAIIAGMLAASAVVIKKLPNAADIIQKIKPYEGFIGAGALAMGIMTLFSISSIMRTGFITMSVTLACIGACIVMGFLLGYPVLQDLFLDELSDETRAKSEEMYERLTPYKVTSGLVGIGTGAYLLISYIF